MSERLDPEGHPIEDSRPRSQWCRACDHARRQHRQASRPPAAPAVPDRGIYEALDRLETAMVRSLAVLEVVDKRLAGVAMLLTRQDDAQDA